MAQGQLTYLQLTNRVLNRLGKPQVASADFAGLAADSYGGIVKDWLNDGQTCLYQEHDWSTLKTSGTFTTSLRTYAMAASFSDFGREVDLVDTTNERRLTPVHQIDLDIADPGLNDSGTPTAYSIDYPNLLFNFTPTSVAYRLRYVKRPTALSAGSGTSDLPEFCDLVLIYYAYYQAMATREDSADYGAAAYRMYTIQLKRAIDMDRRRMDRMYVMQPVLPERYKAVVPFPAAYDREY